MAYRIDYSDPGQKNNTPKEPALRRSMLGMGFFCLFCALVSAFWEEGRAVLQGLLLGPDAEEALHSLEAFAQTLDGGVPLREAAVAFCRELIHGS